jgi:hypothetical protein
MLAHRKCPKDPALAMPATAAASHAAALLRSSAAVLQCQRGLLLARLSGGALSRVLCRCHTPLRDLFSPATAAAATVHAVISDCKWRVANACHHVVKTVATRQSVSTKCHFVPVFLLKSTMHGGDPCHLHCEQQQQQQQCGTVAQCAVHATMLSILLYRCHDMVLPRSC